MEVRIEKKQAFWMLVLLLGAAFLTQMTVGMGFINTYDTFWYRSWAVDAANNGLFSIYSRMEDISLDYPPLYLIPLWLTGLGYKAIGGTGANLFLQMILMKFWPIVCNVACAALLYFICQRRYGRPTGLLAAFLWSLNPAFFFNAVMWGQTDSVMAFLLLLSFWYMEENRTTAACIAFAAAGLTKFQCLFFLPPFIMELILRNTHTRVRIVKGLLAAAATVAVVFLPFMIGAGNPLLFFDVYLGSADKYTYCSLHAYNLYCLLGLNWTTGIQDTDPIFGGFTWNHFSAVCTLLSVALVIWLYILSYRRFKTARLCGWVGGLLIMQCLFMLTTRMHERYQVIVVPFALMAWIATRNKRFLGLFAGISGVSLVNQALVLLNITLSRQENQNAFWTPVQGYLEVVFSFINLLLFLWTIYACVDYFVGQKEERQCVSDGQTPETSAQERG